jgi:hypothetical protein
MTINTRKHTSSIDQVGGERMVLKQTTKSILRVISRFCTLLFILMALCGLAAAQSTDPANPTPITSKEVEGKATGAGATYYYRFSAQKGSVRVTLAGRTNNYSTQFEADLLDSAGKDLGDIYVSADDSGNHAFKDFSFDSDQSVNIVVKLTKDDTLKSQKYSIMLSGAVDFGGQGGGNKENSSPAIPANSSPALPDLIVTDVQIGGTGGNKATVFVSNVCNGDVTADSITIKLIIYKGPDKTSGVAFPLEHVLAPLAGNTSSTYVFDLSMADKVKSFNGRYIRVDVDPYNKIKETIKTNNWFEMGPGRFGPDSGDYKAAPFPNPPDSCKPKSQ